MAHILVLTAADLRLLEEANDDRALEEACLQCDQRCKACNALEC